MTDADLITALGWQPCEWVERGRGDSVWWECEGHRVGSRTRPEACSVISERLRYVRAGIDLARNGIVQAIATADPVAIHVADPGGYIREAFCEIALEWTP